jgi:hypothetical protein
MKMEAVSSSETSVSFYQTHVTTSHKTVIFILANVRTGDLYKWEDNIKIDLKIVRMEGELRAPIPVAARSKA